MQSTRIREASSNDLSAIASIHMAAFPRHFLTRLGKGFLHQYYHLIRSFPSGILLVSEEAKTGKLTGFVGGFLNPPAFYQMMHHKRLALALPMITPILRSPGLVARLLHNRRRVMNTANSQGPQNRVAELSSIAVHPLYQRLGIGKVLVVRFTAQAVEMNAVTIYLTADANDFDSNQFYIRLGFIREPYDDGPPDRPMYKYSKCTT